MSNNQYFSEETFFNEEVKFYKDIYVYGNLYYDFQAKQKEVFNNIDVLGTANFYGPSYFYENVY